MSLVICVFADGEVEARGKKKKIALFGKLYIARNMKNVIKQVYVIKDKYFYSENEKPLIH